MGLSALFPFRSFEVMERLEISCLSVWNGTGLGSKWIQPSCFDRMMFSLRMLREAGFVQMSDAWCAFLSANDRRKGSVPAQIFARSPNMPDVTKPISTLCYAQDAYIGTWFMTHFPCCPMSISCQYVFDRMQKKTCQQF